MEVNFFSKFEQIFEKIINYEHFSTASLLSAVIVVTSSYVFIKWMRMLNYFKKLKIPAPTPKPIVGNFFGLMTKGIVKFDEDLFNHYKSNIVGYYEATTPVILCKDIDMIKHVMIKDFNYFVNRRKFDAVNVDIFKDFLIILRDDEWKNVRSIVTTTFTTGKLKQMVETMEPCFDNILNYIDNLCKNGQTFDATESFQKLTFDVISSTCFGIQTDSIKNPDDPFIKNIKEVLSAQISFKLLFTILFPKLIKKLCEWKLFEHVPSRPLNFFRVFIEHTINQRRNKEQVRNDFIQMMVDHEENIHKSQINENSLTDENNDDNSNIKWKSLKKSLTNNEILAQAFLFLIAGSDTTSIAMTYMSYLLAKHPDIQKRLYEEILKAYQDNDNKIDYDMVNKIEYLEMVIDETLRLYPPALRLDRESSQEYKYKDMTLPKGAVWCLCPWILHRDPSIYPDPEKFDPERFTPENKKKRDNCAFLPFGTGPRNCIGIRFALLQIKLLFCQILLKYEFTVCDKTPETIELGRNGLSKSKHPIILKILKRN